MADLQDQTSSYLESSIRLLGQPGLDVRRLAETLLLNQRALKQEIFNLRDNWPTAGGSPASIDSDGEGTFVGAAAGVKVTEGDLRILGRQLNQGGRGLCEEVAALSETWSAEATTPIVDGDWGGLGYLERTAANTYANRTITRSAADPDVDDDDLDGHAVGSFWFNTTDDKMFVCLDSTTGAAVWIQSTITGGDHGALAGLADDDHSQYHNDTRGDARYYTETELDAGQLDNRYFTEAEHLDSSAGAGDAGKPIKLDAAGHVDATMVNDGDVDHGGLAGLTDIADHPGYVTLDGNRELTNDWDAGSHTITAQVLQANTLTPESGASQGFVHVYDGAASVFCQNTFGGGTMTFNVLGDITLTGTVDGVDVAGHAPRHENAGDDEIDVGGLSGELADDQPPKAHDASKITSGTLVHERGGLEADVSAYNGLVKISGGATSAIALPLTHENGGLEFDASAVAIGDIVVGSGAGTMALVTSAGHDDGDVLTRQADGSADWEAPAGGGGGALDDLTDVTIAAPADNEVLAYDNGTSEWINQTPAEAGLAEATHATKHTDGTDDIRDAKADGTTKGIATFAAGSFVEAQGIISVKESGIDHGTVGGLGDDDHTHYLLADGTRNLSGDWLVNTNKKIKFRDAAIFIHSNADGEMTIEADSVVNIGVAGTTEFGDGSLRVARPQTDEKIDLGDATHRFHDGHFTGQVDCLGGVRTIQSTDDVSNPPTDAQLDTAFGTPAALGAAYLAVLDDNGASANAYLCVTTSSNWWTVAMTKAV